MTTPKAFPIAVLLAICSLSSFATLKASDGDAYQRWFEKDVRWIITQQEAAKWKQLTSDSQRDEFVASFWEKRNPDHNSVINTFKQEHYRRIAYANQHFAASVEGDLTDRGRTYIVYGDPIKRLSGEKMIGGEKVPSEKWVYPSRSFEFIDECRCGLFPLREGSLTDR